MLFNPFFSGASSSRPSFWAGFLATCFIYERGKVHDDPTASLLAVLVISLRHMTRLLEPNSLPVTLRTVGAALLLLLLICSLGLPLFSFSRSLYDSGGTQMRTLRVLLLGGHLVQNHVIVISSRLTARHKLVAYLSFPASTHPHEALVYLICSGGGVF